MIAPGVQTAKTLKEVHELHKAYSKEWLFFIRSYMGGRMYRDGDYLLRHAFESSDNFKRRKQIAYFFNYCSPVVDIFVAHLFKKDPKRDWGSLENHPSFESFIDDADLTGNTYSQFIREVSRLAAVYGHVYIVMDKPSTPAETLADEMDEDIRPYASIVTPENVLDWEYVRKANGRKVLDKVKIKASTNPDQYIIWSRVGWQVWEKLKGGKVVLIGADSHELGEVPIRVVYNKNSGIDGIGLSDIQDIADVNKNIYYLCSDATEIIENTAYPMLAIPQDENPPAGEGAQEQESGPKAIVEFDGQHQGKPFWLEAPHTSLAEIREWISQNITEIFRLAMMAGMKTTETSRQPWSGVAMEVQNQQLMAALQEKADNMEQTEKAILSLWAKWEGTEFDGHIEYPTDFAIRDLTIDFQNAITALSAGVHSETYTRELEKKIVKSTLPKADKKTKRTIEDEIDAADVSGPRPTAINNLETGVRDLEPTAGGTQGGE